jgi:hypothetical protein
MYALERNAWKYRSRDRRKTVEQRIETITSRPTPRRRCSAPFASSSEWTGKAWYVREHEGDALPNEAELRARGRAILADDPDAVDDLFVEGELMERSARPTRILKVAEAWRAYREMLVYYGVRSIASYLDAYGIHYGYFAAQADLSRGRAAAAASDAADIGWGTLGGQLVPEAQVDALRASVRTGLIEDWDGIHAQYETWWVEYPRDRAEDGYRAILAVKDSIG